ncbi:duf298 domain-containing protein [Cystoisospora suis]|uniref:Defective in cullin neddylation protein n=1 Tax=Cystoisospora suis TaxID=483139 RepID=A0A2C6KJW1_9APIC|nr:duf298 domain-containing protein [Cystoisospora suis]
MASRGCSSHPPSVVQQSLVDSFLSVTGFTNRTGAAEFLRRHSFDLSRALDAYFSLPPREQRAIQQFHGGGTSFESSSHSSLSSKGQAAAKARAAERQRQIAETFQVYVHPTGTGAQQEVGSSPSPDHAGGGADVVQLEGLERLAQDLSVGLDDIFFLIFAFLCQCAEQGRITKEEFCRGMDRAGVSTVQELREAVPRLRETLTSDKGFARQVYAFAFTYSLDIGQKSLPIDLCVAYWRLLLSADDFPLMDEWITFIEEVYQKRVSMLSRDSWLMLFDFMQSQGKSTNLDDYDEDGAWPLVIDEFVEWARQRRAGQKQGA